MAKKETVQPKDDSREARWEAWLENARAQRPDTAIFDAQKARGEFDTIPEWFV